MELRVDPGEVYKKRVAKIREKLPVVYRKIIYQDYPQYNTAKGRKLINNVLDGRSADVNLTEILEKIVSGELKLNKHKQPTPAD